MIYGKPDCPLCDKARAAIAASGLAGRFTIRTVDITTDAELFDLYRWDIPVLVAGGREIVKGIVTSERFRTKAQAFLDGLEARPPADSRPTEDPCARG